MRKELGEVLDAIDRVRKEAQGALAAKKEAIEKSNDVFQWVTRALESFFNLAGLPELAKLIRLSVRRKGRRAVDKEDARPAANQPSDDAPPTDASASPADTSPTDASSSDASPADAPPAESESASPAVPPPPSES